jgi:hypothetical protein
MNMYEFANNKNHGPKDAAKVHAKNGGLQAKNVLNAPLASCGLAGSSSKTCTSLPLGLQELFQLVLDTCIACIAVG